MRRSIAVLLSSALTAAMLTACVPSGSDGRSDITRAQLESAGITIVTSEADVTAAPTTLTFTTVQADRLVAEANLGSGILGSDLDAIAPVDAGMPPVSYLLAAWASESDLRGANLAETMFREDTDWTHAADVVFPTAAMALFVADLMDAASDPDSFEPAPGSRGAGETLLTSFEAAVGPCSAVTRFLSATIQGLFDVLRVLPNVIGSIKALGVFASC